MLRSCETSVGRLTGCSRPCAVSAAAFVVRDELGVGKTSLLQYATGRHLVWRCAGHRGRALDGAALRRARLRARQRDAPETTFGQRCCARIRGALRRAGPW